MKKIHSERVLAALLTAALTAGIIPGAVPGRDGAVPVLAAENSGPIAFQYAENGGGERTDAYRNVAYTKDGGFVVSGYTFGDSTSPAWTFAGGDASASHNNNDGVLVKYDKDHKVEWSRAFGGTGIEVFEALDVLEDGRIAVAGRQSFTSSDNMIKGVSWNILVIDPKNPDSYTNYHIGGTSGDQAYGLAATSDGGFVVGGWSASKSGYVTRSTDSGQTWSETQQLWEPADGTDDIIPNRLASGGSDSIVVKFDQAGEIEYCAVHNYEVTEQAYNITNPSERLEGLTVDAEDNILLVGYGSVAKNVQNAVIAKLKGTDGSLLWHRSAGRKEMNVVPADPADYIKAEYMDLAVLSDGSYIAAGTATNDASTDEGWQCMAEKETILVHYTADGSLIKTQSFGTIGDSDSRPEGVTAMPDGGYLLNGSHPGVITEDSLIRKGYDWGNYGGQDALLIKYSADGEVEWSENYGTVNGDWINGTAVSEQGEIIAVGESNGKGGVPAYGNNGGIDGIVMISDGSSESGSTSGGTVKDGAVVWADGAWTGTGTGFGGPLVMQVEIADHKITKVECTENTETDEYYTDAAALFDTIVEKQTAEGVDTVSGATYSSNGILEGAANALSASAAAYVDSLTETAAAAGEADKQAAVQAAADAYAELGTYAITVLQKESDLKEMCAACGITLLKKGDVAELPETKPEAGETLEYNDPYYKLQKRYYDNIGGMVFEQNGITGAGVKIAVIDSGLTPGHRDFNYEKILAGYDYEADTPMNTEDYPLTDSEGHGTAVTSILAAVTNNETGIAGLFSEVEIIPLRLITKKNNDASSAKVARAIREAVDKFGADVITTSLEVKDTEELKEAVAYAVSKNVIITGASGNSSTAESDGSDPYIYPAAYDEVISVGAVDASNNVRASSQKNDQVFVTAPGENIAMASASRGSRCKISSGTSYASPLVAAMAVAGKQLMPGLTPEQFKEFLKNTATDAGPEGYDNSYGYGIVNFAAFLNTVQNQGKASEVIQKIDAIGTVSLESEPAILDAEALYNALTEEQKALVTNADMLTAARETFDRLSRRSNVESAIAAIGEVQADSDERVNAAADAYLALPEEEKSEISNADILGAACAALTDLKLNALKEELDLLDLETSTDIEAAEELKVQAAGTVQAASNAAEVAKAIAADAKTVLEKLQAEGAEEEQVAAAQAVLDAANLAAETADERALYAETLESLTEASAKAVKGNQKTEELSEALAESEAEKEAAESAKTEAETAKVEAESARAAAEAAKVTAEEKAAAALTAQQNAEQAKAAAAEAARAPAKVKVKSLKAKKKALTVKWEKQTGVSGYEIQVAANKKFTKELRIVTVKKANAASKKIKKLTRGKKYYVRVRAYKSVYGGKIYGPWSKKKGKKVK